MEILKQLFSKKRIKGVKSKNYLRKKLRNQKEFVPLFHLMHLPEGEAQFLKTNFFPKMFISSL